MQCLPETSSSQYIRRAVGRRCYRIARSCTDMMLLNTVVHPGSGVLLKAPMMLLNTVVHPGSGKLLKSPWSCTDMMLLNTVSSTPRQRCTTEITYDATEYSSTPRQRCTTEIAGNRQYASVVFLRSLLSPIRLHVFNSLALI